MIFCTSRGSVATWYRWGGQIYNLLVCNSMGIPLIKNRVNQMVFDVTLTSQPSWKTEISVCLSFRHFGIRRVNMAWNIRFVDSYVFNKRAKFGAKIFTHFWEIAIFVLGRFILTHPVHISYRSIVVTVHYCNNSYFCVIVFGFIIGFSSLALALALTALSSLTSMVCICNDMQ